MKNFQRDSKPGGWKGKNFSNREERPMMHKATCVSCGNACNVPFKPNGKKPVFCSDCFKRDDSSGPKRSNFGDRDSGRSNFGDKSSFRATCAKCGSSCQVPFRPTGEKPVYCQDCFGHGGDARVKHAGGGGGGGASVDLSQVMDQFKILNSKLDRLLKTVGDREEAVGNRQENTEVEDVTFVDEPVKEKKKKAAPKSKSKKAK